MATKKESKDSKQIEEKATRAVETFFEDSRIVSTFIDRNDKEPFWDGHLYLYPNGIKKGANFKGRIATQVKGKELKKIKEKNFSHPVKITDLKAYLNEGVIYIVVQEVGKERKIFYKNLTPVIIRNYIRNHAGKKTVNIKMLPLSDNIEEVETELLQFEIDCKKQVSSVNNEPLDFDAMTKMGIKTFSATLAMKDKSQHFLDILTSTPIYLYANINNDARIQIPVGDGPVSLEFIQEIKEPICIQGREFYSSFKKKNGKTDITIEIGGCFELKLKKNTNEEKPEITVNIKRKAKFLKEIINEAEFILAIVNAEEITIGKANIPMRMPDEGHELINELRTNINSWKELEATLNKIGANEDLDMSNLSQVDGQTLDLLIAMVGHDKEMELKEAETGLINVEIANLNLLLLKLKMKSGKYIIKTFFDKSLGMITSYKYPDGEFVESIYGAFDRQMILDCYNFPYFDIIPSYEAIKDSNPHSCERMNLLMLEMLSAYDMMTEQSQRKGMLLKTVIDMSDWLLTNDCKENEILHFVNKCQILKRQEKLTNTEIRVLKRLQLENTANSFFVCGIALLLDDSYSFDFYWEKLSIEEQEGLKKFPIWVFKKKQ
ncbi:hypothetical protein LJB92_02795 [Bacteroidales bacterium OttesenSCG-928-M06]|nr:hypothetical protein [Bacteroidales bacterium OttesenSCG-928-M06]